MTMTFSTVLADLLLGGTGREGRSRSFRWWGRGWGRLRSPRGCWRCCWLCRLWSWAFTTSCSFIQIGSFHANWFRNPRKFWIDGISCCSDDFCNFLFLEPLHNTKTFYAQHFLFLHNGDFCILHNFLPIQTAWASLKFQKLDTPVTWKQRHKVTIITTVASIFFILRTCHYTEVSNRREIHMISHSA